MLISYLNAGCGFFPKMEFLYTQPPTALKLTFLLYIPIIMPPVVKMTKLKEI